MAAAFDKIVDISLELDPRNFAMRTPAGFTKDLQFAMELLKEHDAPGGAGQVVRGVHMRLHAGSHVDAPEHNVPGGGSDKWMKASPYLTIEATRWLIEKSIVIVGYDFYHGNDEPGSPRVFHNSRTLSEHGVITMPYLKNLDRITSNE